MTMNKESQCEAKPQVTSEISLNHSMKDKHEMRISSKFNENCVEKQSTKSQLSNLSCRESLKNQDESLSITKHLDQEKQNKLSNTTSLTAVNSLNQSIQPDIIKSKVAKTSKDEIQIEKIKQNEKKRNQNKGKKTPLRKGKWTVEEEEYTEKMIFLCNSGLLSIPSGMTLRSFLAEKLNCDPMRITKKFAGSSCLWKRSQNTSTKPHLTITEAEVAFKELSYLEARFRLRIDTGFSGINLDSISSPFSEYSTPNVMNMKIQSSSSQDAAHSRLTPEIPGPKKPFASLLFPTSSINPTLNQIDPILPCMQEPFQQLRQNIYALPWSATNLHTDNGSNRIYVNENLSTNDKTTSRWYPTYSSDSISTTAAQLTINQLAQNIQPHLPWTYGNIGFWNAINTNPQTAIPSINNFTQLYSKNSPSSLSLSQQQAYKLKTPWQDQCQNKVENENKTSIDSSRIQENNQSNLSSKSIHSNEKLSKLSTASNVGQRTKEENDSASILLSFLNSLRQNHEAALKTARDENESQKNNKIISQTSITNKETHTVSCSSLNSNSSNETEYQSSNPETLNTLSTSPPQSSDFSSTSSRESSNDDEYYRPVMKNTKSSAKFLPDLNMKNEKTTKNTQTNTIIYNKRYTNILEKNGKNNMPANGSSSDINGSSLSDASGGYFGGGETDRQSTLDSSEGTKTDQSSGSNSSGDDSDKDLSVRQDSRLPKRRKKEPSTCPSWPISRNFQ